MAEKIDHISLEYLRIGNKLDQLQNNFDNIITELIDYLGLMPIYQNIDVKIIEKKEYQEIKDQILDSGVNRTIRNNSILIQIYEICKEILPIILLREAYYCFIPIEVRNKELIKICINQIVENHLSRLSIIKDWRKKVRDSLVDRDYINAQLNKLSKFFKIKGSETFQSTIQFFFNYIRENALIINTYNIDTFYDEIFESYSYKTSKSLFNEEIVETLKILIYEFYKAKEYLNLSDYQDLFKDIKEIGRIKTNLSLRKFTENMRWINKHSYIAPSYEVCFPTIGVYPVYCFLTFNPLINKFKIKQLLENLPFIVAPKIIENSFELEVSFIFFIPKVYLNDLVNYLKKLESFGYLIKNELYINTKSSTLLNLNYFLNFSKIGALIDPSLKNYRKDYEIEYMRELIFDTNIYSPSLLDFILLERVGNYSVTGLTFDKRIETLNALKEDIENEYRKQLGFIRQFNKNLKKVIKSFKIDFLQFINQNQSKGFFYIYDILSKIKISSNLIEQLLKKNPDITNGYLLENYLSKSSISLTIEENIILHNKNLKKILFRELIPKYFQSIKLFRTEIEKISLYYNVFDSCYNLKILDIKSIKLLVENETIVKNINISKEKNLKNSYKSTDIEMITNKTIESKIKKFISYKPILIKPIMINTITTSTFAKYFPFILLVDSPETRKNLEKLKSYFPRTLIGEFEDIITRKKLLYVQIFLLNIKEKNFFMSILYNNFKNNIMFAKRYFWRGVVRKSKSQYNDFYDFANQKFFYTEDLFEQLFIYAQQTLGDAKLPQISTQAVMNRFSIFWMSNMNIGILIKNVKNRLSRQKLNFNPKKINELSEFQKNLEEFLVDPTKFIKIKKAEFFNTNVSSIRFIPAYGQFGLSQYSLYLRPNDWNDIDLKLLFINNFQKIQYPACIDVNQLTFTNYIFPHRNPNKSYLNWLMKSKKAIKESCFFLKKRVSLISHFDRNLSSTGWDYSSNKFKVYMQNILFKHKYDLEIPYIRNFNMEEKSNEGKVYGLHTKEFSALSQIYKWRSIDIKSYLATTNYSIINNITDLIKRRLIFPYISVKNLDFQDKITIILPDIKEDLNNTFIKIFSFFNISRIYQIEGEFYMFGFEKEKFFENGLLIEIWFPKCELDEFFDVFDLLFQYLDVQHYLILTDLVNGENLLKSIYGNLDFLKEYNPLLNLKWNDNDKIWMNHKLFNEKFEPIYPDLINKEKKKG